MAQVEAFNMAAAQSSGETSSSLPDVNGEVINDTLMEELFGESDTTTDIQQSLNSTHSYITPELVKTVVKDVPKLSLPSSQSFRTPATGQIRGAPIGQLSLPNLPKPVSDSKKTPQTVSNTPKTLKSTFNLPSNSQSSSAASSPIPPPSSATATSTRQTTPLVTAQLKTNTKPVAMPQQAQPTEASPADSRLSSPLLSSDPTESSRGSFQNRSNEQVAELRCRLREQQEVARRNSGSGAPYNPDYESVLGPRARHCQREIENFLRDGAMNDPEVPQHHGRRPEAQANNQRPQSNNRERSLPQGQHYAGRPDFINSASGRPVHNHGSFLPNQHQGQTFMPVQAPQHFYQNPANFSNGFQYPQPIYQGEFIVPQSQVNGNPPFVQQQFGNQSQLSNVAQAPFHQVYPPLENGLLNSGPQPRFVNNVNGYFSTGAGGVMIQPAAQPNALYGGGPNASQPGFNQFLGGTGNGTSIPRVETGYSAQAMGSGHASANRLYGQGPVFAQPGHLQEPVLPGAAIQQGFMGNLPNANNNGQSFRVPHIDNFNSNAQVGLHPEPRPSLLQSQTRSNLYVHDEQIPNQHQTRIERFSEQFNSQQQLRAALQQPYQHGVGVYVPFNLQSNGPDNETANLVKAEVVSTTTCSPDTSNIESASSATYQSNSLEAKAFHDKTKSQSQPLQSNSQKFLNRVNRTLVLPPQVSDTNQQGLKRKQEDGSQRSMKQDPFKRTRPLVPSVPMGKVHTDRIEVEFYSGKQYSWMTSTRRDGMAVDLNSNTQAKKETDNDQALSMQLNTRGDGDSISDEEEHNRQLEKELLEAFNADD